MRSIVLVFSGELLKSLKKKQTSTIILTHVYFVCWIGKEKHMVNGIYNLIESNILHFELISSDFRWIFHMGIEYGESISHVKISIPHPCINAIYHRRTHLQLKDSSFKTRSLTWGFLIVFQFATHLLRAFEVCAFLRRNADPY